MLSLTPTQLASQIKQWGAELGFADIGISHTDLSKYEAGYFNWIGQNFHGEMAYMERHGLKRTRPNELEPGTTSVISARLNYLDTESKNPAEILHQSQSAYIARYALNKDYHKLMRKRLQQLAAKIEALQGPFQYRAFCDSAPVLERPIAEQAGLGFIGKNSLVIHPRAGSWFFLGELYTNLNLPADAAFEKQGCGPCQACITECPTQAIVNNGVVDARRCISYLTIEYKGTIPVEFRPLMGNRIYGCDDCQLVCPWNRFSDSTQETGFQSEKGLDNIKLLTLWQWSEQKFLRFFEGSPIRRIGYQQWQRNLAVALGNVVAEAATLQQVKQALEEREHTADSLVKEHIEWALETIQKRLEDKIFTATTQPETLKPFSAPKYYHPQIKANTTQRGS